MILCLKMPVSHAAIETMAGLERRQPGFRRKVIFAPDKAQPEALIQATTNTGHLFTIPQRHRDEHHHS